MNWHKNGYGAIIYMIDKNGAAAIHSIERANTTERSKRLVTDAAACFVAKQDKQDGQFYGIQIRSNIKSYSTLITIDAANLAAVVYELSKHDDSPYLFRLMQAQKIGQAVNFWHNDFFKINYNQRIFNREEGRAFSIMKKNGSVRAEKNRLAVFAKSKNVIPKKLHYDFTVTDHLDFLRIDAS